MKCATWRIQRVFYDPTRGGALVVIHGGITPIDGLING